MEGSNSLPLSMEDSHMPVGYQEEGGKGVLKFWIDQRIILTKNLGKLWQLQEFFSCLFNFKEIANLLKTQLL